MIKSPKRQFVLPRLESILTARTNELIKSKRMQARVNVGVNANANVNVSSECNKVNVEFRSPRKSVMSYRNEPIDLICSYQKHLLSRGSSRTKGEGRYSVMSWRDGKERKDNCMESINK